jgi:MFS family permease
LGTNVQDEKPPPHQAYSVGVLVILLVGQAMASMDEEILVVASPSLRQNLHASAAELQLILAMYTIMFAALVVIGARFGDVIGRRPAFLIGLGGFSAASVAGGLAPGPKALIVARAMQGASAALMTPQVLSIIQIQFDGERRARAIGAYSMVLAVGVAIGQVLGGFLVSLHLLSAQWRPALLLNGPLGASLFLVAYRALPEVQRGVRRRLDPAGAALLSGALLALVVPLTLGRETGWPAWTWPCLFGCVSALIAFVALERRQATRGRDPLFDLGIMMRPGVAPGLAAVILVMSCYTGLLVSLTLHVQSSLGFSPLNAGLIFTAYAAGFALASLGWTHASARVRDRLPDLGPLAMGAAMLGIGLVTAGGGWPVLVTTVLLFCTGAGHACGFSPLASHLTDVVGSERAADLSGLILTASVVGQVLGLAAFVGVYFSALPRGSAPAFALTTIVLAASLVPTAMCSRISTRRASRPKC